MSHRAHSETTEDKSVLIEEKNSKGETIQKYIKGRFLGKGGFAKCYELINVDTKQVYAAKMIVKASLTKNRAKQKLMSEIKIHKSLRHQYIVGFEHFFEDSENVYILLEMCDNNTMNELLKRRKRLTELEVQCYMLQMLGAIKYLHNHRVIHRDLKLGNLFLNDKMEIKMGDFGLAAKLEYDGEKKRTICGTPNYIAPEILEGKTGHSYEVDVWSLGVILYTLLIGKPPFETADVKTTYKKIRMNSYTFPDHVIISSAAKDLIIRILASDPAKRPSLDEIINHVFFTTGGTIPKTLPTSTLACPPSASYLRQFMAPSREKELHMYRSSSPQRFESTTPASAGLPKPSLNERKDFINTERVVKGSNSVQNFIPPTNLNYVNSGVATKAENPYIARPSYSDKPGMTTTRSQTKLITIEDQPRRIKEEEFVSSKRVTEPNEEHLYNTNGSRKSSTIKHSGSCKNLAATVNIQSQQLNGPDIWIKRWVDYSSKYGLGYLLNNGCTGVFFNDSTKILLEPKGSKFIYIGGKGPDRQDIINEYTLLDFPKDIQKKVTLLQHFKSHLEAEETKNKGYIEKEAAELSENEFKSFVHTYVKKWMKTKHAIMFRMSSKVVQIIFQDQTEIILSSELKIVTYVNKKQEKLHYPLSTALQSSNNEMTKRLKYTKDVLAQMLGGANIIPSHHGDENKKSQPELSSRNTRSSSNLHKHTGNNDQLMMSGRNYSSKREDSMGLTTEGRGSFRLTVQTGRPSLHGTGVAMNALMEKAL